MSQYVARSPQVNKKPPARANGCATDKEVLTGASLRAVCEIAPQVVTVNRLHRTNFCDEIVQKFAPQNHSMFQLK
jgi:hypothetical protein